MNYKIKSLVLLTKVLFSDSFSPHTTSQKEGLYYFLGRSDRNPDGSWSNFRSTIHGTDAIAVLDVFTQFQIVGTPADYAEVYSGVPKDTTDLHQLSVKLNQGGFEFEEEGKYTFSTPDNPAQVTIPIDYESRLFEESEDGLVMFRVGNKVTLLLPKQVGWAQKQDFLCGGTDANPRRLRYINSASMSPWTVKVDWGDLGAWGAVHRIRGYTIMPVPSRTPVPSHLFNIYKNHAKVFGFQMDMFGTMTKQPCDDYEQIVDLFPSITMNIENGIQISVTPDKFILQEMHDQVSRCTIRLYNEKLPWMGTIVSGFDLLGDRESIHFTKYGGLGFCEPK